jgi:hypothetical protein
VGRSPVSFFTSPHDLATQVTVSFVNLRDRRPATGFIRADQVPDLKKYADLLEENARLREEIARTREFAVIPFPHASETIEIEIFYYNFQTLRRGGIPESWKISISWKELFILVVEKILTTRDWKREIVNDFFCSARTEIAAKDGDKVENYNVDETNSFSVIDLIILRLIGWRLLEGDVGVPRLTEYGQKQYGLLMP